MMNSRHETGLVVFFLLHSHLNQFFKVWLINIHASTKAKDDEAKGNLYDSPGSLFYPLPLNEEKIILDNFNSKVRNKQAQNRS